MVDNCKSYLEFRDGHAEERDPGDTWNGFTFEGCRNQCADMHTYFKEDKRKHGDSNSIIF